MIAPNAEVIEGAVEHLKSLPENFRDMELNEFRSALHSDFTDEMGTGYLIGLETARRMIQQSTVVVMSSIRTEDVANIL